MFDEDRLDESEELEKIIFLDIDGVLNDEGEEYKKGVYLDEKRIQRLGEIVARTGAKIVLSSSWRVLYQRFQENNFEGDDEQLLRLHSLFCKYHISVAGVTPCISSGPRARPAEIRCWLMTKVNVKRFVILDDDTFWMWRWLSDYLVLTRRGEGFNKKLGLEDEHVEKAVAILNR